MFSVLRKEISYLFLSLVVWRILPHVIMGLIQVRGDVVPVNPSRFVRFVAKTTARLQKFEQALPEMLSSLRKELGIRNRLSEAL